MIMSIQWANVNLDIINDVCNDFSNIDKIENF